MPSLLITLLSIFRIAALIVRAVGNTVKPILIAFERFVSSTVISFFTSPPFYIEKKNIRYSFEKISQQNLENIFPEEKRNKKRMYMKSTLTQKRQ